ncbi:MAG: DUF6456 domain-containing protein [Hoeflea sp.]|uniref:DUF6456 domain-containing protein n=1 Tax=Hoeflea sp. TaxID=1940281 RepID=UPI0032EFCC06
MKTAEMRALRKALSGMIGFLARGAAEAAESRTGGSGVGGRGTGGPCPKIELVRGDGTRRRVAPAILRAALARGLVSCKTAPGSRSEAPIRSYELTSAGRAALRRLLADPDSAFQQQHRRLGVRHDAEHGSLAVNDLESPLAALARIKGRDGEPFLAPDLVEVGERLRADFTRGHLTPSIGQSWEPVRAGRAVGDQSGLNDLTDAALSARRRVEDAIAALGPDLSGVALDACCFLKGLSLIERERQWPARSAKLMLRTALAALARHYAAPGRKPVTQRAPPPHAP